MKACALVLILQTRGFEISPNHIYNFSSYSNNPMMEIPKNSPAYIDSLCDLIPNKKRPLGDFKKLLDVLEQSPKECTPFKGKILQHLQIHSLDLSKSCNFRLLASCYAKATILCRKGPNKDEGPVGEWKLGFTESLLELDRNLDKLYEIAGVNAMKIVVADKNKEEEELESEKKFQEANSSGYQIIINEYLSKVNWSAHCICALISIKTEFDIPIPVQILLKTATKISYLKWKDYRKKPNTTIRSYIYSLTPQMLDISFMLFHSLVSVLDSNIIPFTQVINQTFLGLLEWTRTSNLSNHEEVSFHSIRAKLFELLSFLLDQLSLNVNLEPESLKKLLEVEILDNLESILEKCDTKPASDVILESSQNLHALNAMHCLENLLIVYDKYLETSTEGKVKNCIVQFCINIYRDFKFNTINLQCRKQLLEVLSVIANQPYASSTTEIAYHIFELVKKLESDREMKAIAQKCLKIGLSHRPTIVSSYDVYNCYNHPMLTTGTVEMQIDQAKVNELEVESNPLGMEVADETGEKPEIEIIKESSLEVNGDSRRQPTAEVSNGIAKNPIEETAEGLVESAEDLILAGEDLNQAGEDDVEVNKIMSCLHA